MTMTVNQGVVLSPQLERASRSSRRVCIPRSTRFTSRDYLKAAVMPPLVCVEFEQTRAQSSDTCTGGETYPDAY
jgi:hypothetical protein